MASIQREYGGQIRRLARQLADDVAGFGDTRMVKRVLKRVTAQAFKQVNEDASLAQEYIREHGKTNP